MKKLTKQMKQELNTVWGRIGGDILTSVEECTGNSSIPRNEVADVVIDHMRNGHGVSQETLAFLDGIEDMGELLQTVEQAFPFETYGW